MAKKSPQTKSAGRAAPKKAVKPSAAKKRKPVARTRSGIPKNAPREDAKITKADLRERMEEAKKLEARDAAPPPVSKSASSTLQLSSTSNPERNSDFPKTFIEEILVSLDDPDHWITLKWKGPKASSQDKGPFRSSPGAGVKGIDCNNETTSRRSGTKCTPKGTLFVKGFQRRLNSAPSATYVTWFQRMRGIALHYYPSVPRYAASHGCVRLETERVARLIQDNSQVDITKVTVSGTWTKPAKQW